MEGFTSAGVEDEEGPCGGCGGDVLLCRLHGCCDHPGHPGVSPQLLSGNYIRSKLNAPSHLCSAFRLVSREE